MTYWQPKLCNPITGLLCHWLWCHSRCSKSMNGKENILKTVVFPNSFQFVSIEKLRWGLRTVVAVACFPHFNICFASFNSMDTFSSVTLISFGSGIVCAFRSSLFLLPRVNVKPAFAVISLNILFTIKCCYFSSPRRVFYFLVFCSQLGNNIFFE